MLENGHPAAGWMLGFCGFLALSVGVGCGPTQKLRPFDASRPIETEKGYRQEGELINGADMWKQLKADPDTGGHVRRAEVLDLVSLVTMSCGGALIGYPLGQAAAGASDPIWELAAVGGGFVAVSIPLVVWSVSSRNKAIFVHNTGVSQPYIKAEGSPLIFGSNSVGVAW